MTVHATSLASVALLVGVCIGCGDGRLDVLEPIPRGDSSSGGSGGSGAGSSGTTGASGTSASAGRAAGAGSSSVASPFILDDFEDGNTQSSSIPDGYWYFTPDPSSSCSGAFSIEAVEGRTDNAHAIRVRGGACMDWGALLGLDLGDETFDTSNFDELRLWARAEPGSVTQISVSLLDPHHFDTIIDVTTEWQEFRLPLGGFVFNDQGDALPFNRGALTHLQFFIFSADAFDFWLDDLAFARTR